MALLRTLLTLLSAPALLHAQTTATAPATPLATGVGASPSAWEAAYARASALVAQMTLAELNNATYGAPAANGCSGTSGAVPRLGFPGLCLLDGPAGAHTELVSGFAAGVSVAASFNEELAHTRGSFMGAEFRRKGVQAVNGPVAGPLGRIATDGRAWEGFGADAYLSGRLAAQTVAGLQKSVVSVVKHYILNEQETHRFHLNGVTPLPSESSNADDITLHELYLPPFQDAVHAGAAAVMCSYNRVDETYACENNNTLNTILKGELNFQGFVVSDWYAQQSGVGSAAAGLDMAMPNSMGFWDNNTLAKAVNSSQLPRARLEDMVTRIVASWYLTDGNGTYPPGFGVPQDLLGAHELVEGRDPASKPSTKQAAVEGHVLVKNVNGALPLNKPKMLSLFGWDGRIPPIVNPAPVTAPYSKMNLGFQSVNISDSTILQAVVGNPPYPAPEVAALGTVLVGGGSGSNMNPYWSDPYSAIMQQAQEDDTFLWWDFQSVTPLVAGSSSACLVFGNQFSSEAEDRSSLHDNETDTLVNTVAGSCNNTIVVLHNAWIRVVDAWIDHPNVTAVIFAHLPGQDSGSALADILYGRVSPSGRLPYTLGHNESQYGSLLLPADPAPNATGRNANFTEGTMIDYRHFLSQNIEPRFPFGFGLTYSNFSYSNIKAQWSVSNLTTDPPNPDAKIPGGISSLFDNVASVSADVRNTGGVAAAEVAQLYLQPPGIDQVRVLKGFSKQLIPSGQSTQVQFNLTRRDMSRWNPFAQSWQLQKGQYKIFVGPNVEEVPLQASLQH